jgi:hypothetical protein
MPDMRGSLKVCRSFWERRKLDIVFISIYVLLSIYAMLHFMEVSYLGDRYFKTVFDGMYLGTTVKPFVYRQLVPSLTRAIVWLTPQTVIDGVNTWVSVIQYNYEMTKLPVALTFITRAFPYAGEHYQRVVTSCIIYGCLWGYIWALRRLAAELFPGNAAITYMAPVFGVLAISSFSFPFQYIYDIAVLFLSTACYYCLAARKWKTYFVFFFLACVNKETAIFIFLFSTIWFFRKMEWKMYVNFWVVQYLIYTIVRIFLLYEYIDNGGEYLRNHLFRVLPGDLMSISKYDRILTLSFIFIMLSYKWPDKPDFLKCGLWLMPPMYLAYLLFGMPGEYRVFFDILPLLVMLGVHTLVAASGIDRASLFNQPASARSIHENR